MNARSTGEVGDHEPQVRSDDSTDTVSKTLCPEGHHPILATKLDDPPTAALEGNDLGLIGAMLAENPYAGIHNALSIKPNVAVVTRNAHQSTGLELELDDDARICAITSNEHCLLPHSNWLFDDAKPFMLGMLGEMEFGF